MNVIELVKEVGLFDKDVIVKEFREDSWQRTAFNDFYQTVTSKENPFPCVFGVHGLKQNHLRFIFHDNIDISLLSRQLKLYVDNSRGYGNNTSLMLFTNIEQGLEIDEYFQIFWSTLQLLSEYDRQPWPSHIPEDTSHTQWEFCFGGEPIFVVCNTPSHVMRYSRHSHRFMITFQPRWVFDNILGTPQQATKAFSSVRAILDDYDVTPISPDLGIYGSEGVLESRQYFLDDVNIPKECPFSKLGKK